MNWTDILVLVIIIISTVAAYRAGFVKACFNFFSSIISLVLAYNLYPVVSKWLRDSGWFDTVKQSVSSTLNLKQNIEQLSLNAQSEFINSLDLPNFLKSALIENNNSEIYSILDVSQIDQYISGYIASMCINIIAMIGTFLIVLIIIKVLVSVLDLVAKLPVLNFANRNLGAILGFAKGLLIVWILCVVVTFFYSNPTFEPVIAAIRQSTIAKFLYENNWLIFMVNQIFA